MTTDLTPRLDPALRDRFESLPELVDAIEDPERARAFRDARFAALAESAVSRHMREQLNLSDDPSVRVYIFPFLVQVVAGTYRSVDVTAEHISVGPLRDVQLRTQLRGVQVPLSELLGGGPRRGPTQTRWQTSRGTRTWRP